MAYPSVYMETACISAIEAMSAKCMVVCPNLGALPETCANFAWMYGYEPNPEKHISVHAHILGKAIENYWATETQTLLTRPLKFNLGFWGPGESVFSVLHLPSKLLLRKHRRLPVVPGQVGAAD